MHLAPGVVTIKWVNTQEALRTECGTWSPLVKNSARKMDGVALARLKCNLRVRGAPAQASGLMTGRPPRVSVHHQPAQPCLVGLPLPVAQRAPSGVPPFSPFGHFTEPPDGLPERALQPFTGQSTLPVIKSRGYVDHQLEMVATVPTL